MEINTVITKGQDREDIFNSGVRYCFIGEKNGREISIDFTKEGIKEFQPNSTTNDEIAKWKAQFDLEVKAYTKEKKKAQYKAHVQRKIDLADVGEIKLHKFNLIKKEVKYFK